MTINKLKSFFWSLIKKFSSLNFSIFLLLLISSLSVLGTIIEQNQTLEYYKNTYPNTTENLSLLRFNWKIIIISGLDHLYDNWWFLLLLSLFFLSLTSCTLSRQLPSLKYARNWKFSKSNSKFDKLIDSQAFRNKYISNIIYFINTKNYFLFHQKNNIYGNLGLFGRIAPIFVHMSIILTISGSLIGLINGFTAQEMIPKGEIFHIKNIIKVGQIANLPINITGKINNFWINYNEDRSIQQFFSRIEILNNKGERIIEKQISVNQPLIFNHISFYQTDWQINALRLNIGHQYNIQRKTEKKELDGKSIWISRLPVNDKQIIFLIIYNLQDNISIYNSNGKLITEVHKNQNFYVNKSLINVQEIITSTGIQIKTDPGIPAVYTGFLILMISTIVSYVSYSQIWVNIDKKNLRLTGSTNRSTLVFENDFINIQESYIFSITNNRSDETRNFEL
uniref:Cytochrome c biogenesis protein CcsB n=1 Tax=Gelidium vagum TaxID=35171 RepID=A0A141SE76_GELVA|nr:c-type cytochrome biogenensis protein [Gelidium vagum]AMK96594.1 c-type cytochrome biogenensis protein [Gelidium vagum]